VRADVAISPYYLWAEPALGGGIDVTVAVMNVGAVAAQNVAVRIRAGNPVTGTLVYSGVVASLAPDSQELVRVRWRAPLSSRTVLYAWANPDRVLAETRSDNNLASLETTLNTVQRALQPGWNLVSFAVSPLSGTLPITRVQDVLASVGGAYDAVQWYDSADTADPWKIYNPAAPDYANDLHELACGQGFWVHMIQTKTFRLTGAPIVSQTIPLHSGFNLIGWPLTRSRNLPLALSSISGKYRSVWSYAGDGANPAWFRYAPGAPAWANNLSSLQAGKGYWIEVTQDCVWGIN
jgi:hypothetical protein